MNTPLLALPLATNIPGSLKKKRVLLVDASPAKRDLRAEVMRKLGMDVDCLPTSQKLVPGGEQICIILS